MDEEKPRRASRERAAFHEAGHALAAYFRPLAGRTRRVTLEAADLEAHNAGLPDEEHAGGVHSRRRTLPAVVGGGLSVDVDALRHQLVVTMAGHAAEGLMYPDGLSGGAGDAVNARSMILAAYRWELLADACDALGVADLEAVAADPTVKAAVAERAADGLMARMDAATTEALELLTVKRHALAAVARALLRRGSLTGDEVAAIVEGAEERHERGILRRA